MFLIFNFSAKTLQLIPSNSNEFTWWKMPTNATRTVRNWKKHSDHCQSHQSLRNLRCTNSWLLMRLSEMMKTHWRGKTRFHTRQNQCLEVEVCLPFRGSRVHSKTTALLAENRLLLWRYFNNKRRYFKAIWFAYLLGMISSQLLHWYAFGMSENCRKPSWELLKSSQ